MCNVQHNVTNHTETTVKVKFLRNEEQHCLLPSLVDDFTCVHSKNALLTHILSTLFSSTSVLFSCTPFGIKSLYILLSSSSSQDRGKSLWVSQDSKPQAHRTGHKFAFNDNFSKFIKHFDHQRRNQDCTVSVIQ